MLGTRRQLCRCISDSWVGHWKLRYGAAVYSVREAWRGGGALLSLMWWGQACQLPLAWHIVSSVFTPLPHTTPAQETTPRGRIATCTCPHSTSSSILSSSYKGKPVNTKHMLAAPPHPQITKPLWDFSVLFASSFSLSLVLYNYGMKCGLIATKQPPY